MKCPYCSYENEDSALTCGLCQQKLNKGAGQETPMPAQNLPQRSYPSSVIQEEEKASFGKIDIILTLNESFVFLIKNPIIFVLFIPSVLATLMIKQKEFIILSVIFSLLSFFAYLLAISFIGSKKTGSFSSWNDIFIFTFTRILIVIGNILIVGVISGIMSLIFLALKLYQSAVIIPIILLGGYFRLRFIFVLQAIMLDEKGPIKAFSESWNITKGNVLRLFLVLLIIFLPTLILAGILASALGPVHQLGSTIAVSIAFPFFVTAITIAYLNLT